MKEFDGKTIWISGASRGIGRETALQLNHTNANLALSASGLSSFTEADRNKYNMDKTSFHAVDLMQTDSIKTGYEEIKNRHGRVDILINNAGVGKFKPFLELSAEDFERMNTINFKSVFHTIKQALPSMVDNNFGIIINVLSVAVRTSFLGCSVYGASKAAVLEMTNVIRTEYRKNGIKVINIFPGATATDIWSPKVLEKFSDKMMPASAVAKSIKNVLSLAIENDIHPEEIIIRPNEGDL